MQGQIPQSMSPHMSPTSKPPNDRTESNKHKLDKENILMDTTNNHDKTPVMDPSVRPPPAPVHPDLIDLDTPPTPSPEPNTTTDTSFPTSPPRMISDSPPAATKLKTKTQSSASEDLTCSQTHSNIGLNTMSIILLLACKHIKINMFAYNSKNFKDNIQCRVNSMKLSKLPTPIA